MNEDQINELKSLVDELTTQGLSTEEIQSRVDKRKAEFAETVEVTEEIQTGPTEGKTNGAVAKGATATPVTGQAPESTVSDSVDTSGELQANDQGYFRQERKKGRLAEDIRQDVYNASEQITKPVRKVDDQGEFVYGDQRDLNKQVADYNVALNDLINAKGQFENFADYTQEERLNLVDKVIAKPNYNKKVYNQNTDTYEIEPTKEFVSMVESHMPSDMEMYDTPEEWAQALNQGRSQAFSKDPVMRTALNAQVKLNADKVNEYQESLKDKYDFSNPETFEANLALANSDVDKYIQEEILVPFENSDLFKSLQTQYLDVSESILADKNKQYARAQHSFLDEGGLSEFALIEGTVKGVKQMSLGFNQADLSKFHGQVASINSDINKLQTEIDSGNLTLDSEITDPLNRRMKITVRERLNTLNDRKDNRVKRIVDKVGKISEKEEELGLFKEADFDNLTFEGAMIGLGEALPQVTAAGLTGLVSGGMGLAVIFAQEYGGNYYDAITKGLEQDGIKPTPENIAKAVEEGNYANRAESAAFAALQASLERVGATQVMKGFTKGIGLGTDFKKATSSLYKGEMKKFATQLPKKAKSVAMGGFSEAITEGAQTGLSQVSTAVQLDLPVATFIDPSEIKTAAQQGGLVGTILPFSGRVAGQSGIELRAMARDVSTKFNLRDAKQIKLVDGFFKEAESSLAGLRDQGIISKEEYSEQSQELANARNTGMKIPEYFSNQDKQRSYDLILERDKLEKEVKQTDKALAVEQLNNIETINEELNRIARSQQPVAEAIAKTQKAKTATGADVIAEQLGIKPIERYQTQEEVDARKEQLRKENKNLNVSASASYGNAYTLDDGSTVIVINEQIAKEDNVYTTDQHEVLHPLTRQTFANNPKAAIAFGKSLLEELNNNPKVKINNPAFQKRLLDYVRAGKTEAETMEEVLNLTSEALSDGSITIQESTLVKIGNYVRKFLRDAGVLSIKFNSGKDVLSFIRDYNTTIEKGKGLGKAAKAVATEGAKGKLVTETTTETTTGSTESASLRTPKGQEFISLVDEGILTNESLVDVVKSPSSTQEDKFGAIEAVVEKNWPVISKAVKFNPTGSIPMDAVKEAVTEQIQGIFPGRGTALFDTYNPETSQVNTFIGSTLGPRQAEILERAQTIGGRTQAADITEARGIAAEETSTPQPKTTTKKLIDSRTFGPAAGVSIDNIVTIKQGEKPSFRELAEQNLDEVSTKVFNVPGKKIRGRATLTDGEAKSLQRLFVDPNNVRKLIKTMPPYNVAGSETVINEQGETIDVSKGFKGKSIGLSTKFINKYYQPVTEAIPGISNASGRSLGLTTQTQVYELKPEYTGRVSNEVVKQIQDDVGVTESGVPNKKISAENRSKYGTTLTGFAKTYLANAINAAGRGKQATKQEQADTGAGKSKDAASLRRVSPNVFMGQINADTDFASYNIDYNKTLTEILKGTGVKKINMKTPEGRERFLQFAVDSGFTKKTPPSFWRALAFTTENALTLKDIKELKEQDPDAYKTVFTESDILGDLREYTGNLPFKNTEEAQVWIDETGLENFASEKDSPGFAAMLKKEGVYSQKLRLDKSLNDPVFVQRQDDSIDQLGRLFEILQNDVMRNSDGTMNFDGVAFTGALLSSSSYGQGHFLRTAAPYRFYEEGYMDTGSSQNTLEHTLPATIVGKYLFVQALDGSVSKAFEGVRKNYFQGPLSKTNDKKLKGISDIDEKFFDYIDQTPQGWMITDNIWARYFNMDVASNRFGIDPNTIKLTGGKSVFDIYNVDATGSRISDVGNLSRQKASVVNNSKIIGPTREKSSLRKSMPNTLDNMSNLDADAKQANKQFYDSLDLNKEFNDILEVKTGIASEKRYKRVKAEVVGANKGRFQFFIPPSAEDFTGLLYSTLAKGKLGDAQMAWYKKNLLDPYGKAMNELSSARIAMMNDYKALKKELKLVPKDLRKKVPGEPFTQEQAVRVYIWQKQGMSVPGISEADMQDLSDFVEGKEDLKTFADQLMYIQKGDQYAGPKEGWPAGTITTDMLEGLNTIKRAKALEQWQANADEIFSEENLNKLEAAYGKPYRKAMENMLQRMKSGRNRNFQGDTLTGRVTDWLTGSIGTIMFFNTRSALLQTISSINFVNFTDNNILAAGKAFANQKQYWSDFMTLINSDFLKERRGGLRINVNEADIADMAKRGGARGVINKLLEFGFTPTQIADSFAIASGGATFYRNRIKSLKKQGMTDTEAEAQAFVDFRETAEESQQSSRPDRISMQQAGQLGRLVLAFANTPAQYARLIKKAASDLKNGRGDAKTNISKIIYYGVAQNLLFNALQQALFAFAFDDDEEDTDEQQKKYVSIANGMMDSLLRGMGLGGAVVSVGKNAIIRIINEMEKKQPKLEKVGYELTKLSPPISAKLSRVNQAARSYQWDKKEMIEKGWSLDNPAYLAGANVIAALTNIPLDRAVKKTNNVVQATSQDLETWERLALLGGWQDWEIGVDEEKPSNKPQPRKSTSKYKKSKIK
jgi:hypothetical protein